MLKVGDKAKFVGTAYWPYGDVIIQDIRPDMDLKYKAESEFGGWIGSFYESDLELIVPAPVKLTSKPLLPAEADERKKLPMAGGLMDYFTAALVEVSKVSYKGNEQHNPGQPLHWARGKSNDQSDTLIRHFIERGSFDTDGIRHSAKMCWRALAILQLELEAEGAPIARGARLPDEEKKG
jgi:hypothetical protein